MRRTLLPAIVVMLCAAGAPLPGCDSASRTAAAKSLGEFFKTDLHRWFSPDEMVDAPDQASISPILPSVGMGDTHQELVPNATFPREGDWSYAPTDYVIGPTDVLDIGIMDLFQQGIEQILRRQVSDSGQIDLPLLQARLKVAGLTGEGLRGAIKSAYQKAEVLRDATVSVSVVAQRQNTFSVLGAIARPGTYNIARRDMRLLESLAAAGGITQTNIRYIYVIRPAPATVVEEGPEAKPVPPPGEAPLPKIPTEAETQPTTQAATQPATEPATQPVTKPATKPGELTEPTDVEKLMKELGVPSGPPTSKPAEERLVPSEMLHLSETAATAPVADQRPSPAARRSQWIYSGGRWIRVEEEAPPATQPSGKGAPPVHPAEQPPERREVLAPRGEEVLEPGTVKDPYGWEKIEKGYLARIIAISLKDLEAGNPRMNIVVRDNDVVQVPTLEVGEFYVGGDVLRPGVYSMTGREVTVKQAVIAAGNISPLGWPENSILVRRIGDFQEQVMALNIDAIFRSREPDVFLRPNDVIVVGSDIRAPFWAVIRNAFRATYGFGFIYDRNFADPLSPLGGYNSDRFKRL